MQTASKVAVAKRENRTPRNQDLRCKFSLSEGCKGGIAQRAELARRGATLPSNRWRFVHTVASVFCLVTVWLSHVGALAHEARVDIGLLTCHIVQISETGRTGEAPAPEGRELLCTFTPTASRPEETYSGSVQSIGSDNELSAGRAMIWIVLAPSEVDMTPGLLQQVYAADSAAALRQAPPLLGQTNGSIVLQDLTDAKQLGAAAGRQDDLASTIVVLVLRLRTTPT